jgi:hypothetical protein
MRGLRRGSHGVVYAFVAESLGVVKIGFATDTTRRLIAARLNCPVPLYMAACVPGTIADERQTHLRFADARVHGEWFRLTSEVRDWIRSNAVEPTVTRMMTSFSDPARKGGRRTQYDEFGRWAGCDSGAPSIPQ